MPKHDPSFCGPEDFAGSDFIDPAEVQRDYERCLDQLIRAELPLAPVSMEAALEADNARLRRRCNGLIRSLRRARDQRDAASHYVAGYADSLDALLDLDGEIARLKAENAQLREELHDRRPVE